MTQRFNRLGTKEELFLQLDSISMNTAEIAMKHRRLARVENSSEVCEALTIWRPFRTRRLWGSPGDKSLTKHI